MWWIENYMPDFARFMIFDSPKPENRGISWFLVDLDNTLIAWNNPDGTSRDERWLHDLRDAGIALSVPNTQKRPTSS